MLGATALKRVDSLGGGLIDDASREPTVKQGLQIVR